MGRGSVLHKVDLLSVQMGNNVRMEEVLQHFRIALPSGRVLEEIRPDDSTTQDRGPDGLGQLGDANWAMGQFGDGTLRR